MKRTLLYSLIFCASLFASHAAVAQAFSLEDCRREAQKMNRQSINARLEVDMAHQMRREAFTNYFPKITASGTVFQSQEGLVQADMGVHIPVLGDLSMPLSFVKRGYMTSITAVQPVFAGLKIVNGNKLARLNEEVMRLDLERNEAEVRQKVDTYFWQIVSLKDQLKTLDAVERQLDEIERQVRLSIEAGLVTKNDLLRVELRQQEIESARLKLENGLHVSKLVLAQYVGRASEGFDIEYQGFEAVKNPSTYYVSLDEALDRRAEYQMAAKNVTAHKYQKRMERGKFLPTVGVGAGYLYYNITDKKQNQGVVFAQVSVPISDWWGGAHALKRAALKERQAENNRQEAEEMMLIEIQKSWSDLLEAYAQISIAERSVASSTENLRQMRHTYAAGTTSMTDLLDAETLFTRTRHDLTASYAAYQTALAHYMRVTGR